MDLHALYPFIFSVFTVIHSGLYEGQLHDEAAREELFGVKKKKLFFFFTEKDDLFLFSKPCTVTDAKVDFEIRSTYCLFHQKCFMTMSFISSY